VPLPRANHIADGLKWLKLGAWIVAASVCAVVAVYAYSRLRHHEEPTTFTPVPFTSFPGHELFPTFSPDGSQITFAWDGDPANGSKGFDLYAKVIGSENLLRLTHHPSELLAAAWSPDGTQIAFYRIAGADTGIYVIPALGGPEKRLRATTHRIDLDSHTPPISWSPDGKWIAFTEWHPQEQGWRLHLLSVETLESKQMPHVAECLQEGVPAFSHSGKQLGYFCVLKAAPDNEMGIYSIATAGGSPKLVSKFGTGWGWPAGFVWTADDKSLILSRPRVGNDFELDEVTVADGSLRKLLFGQDAAWPAISAKGDKLAYVSFSPSHVDIWRKDLSHPEAAAVKLISSTHDQNGPQYSPDGKHIAFSSTRGGANEIWMSNADGTNVVQMSDFKNSFSGAPHWSPDSQKLAFDSWESGHPSVYIVDISERMPRKVVCNLSDMATPSWSHDGKWLYLMARTEHAPETRIFRCSASGGDGFELSANPGSFPSESYEEGTLYFLNRKSGALDMISLKPPGPESVLIGMPTVSDQTMWTVVSEGIYFEPADSSQSIRYFDFASKQVRQIFRADKDFNAGLSVSPDGRWMLYTQVVDDQNSSNIMLVEHFR
jgi:Tol biopolymer transport system component